jgi:hypothetical protein
LAAVNQTFPTTPVFSPAGPPILSGSFSQPQKKGVRKLFKTFLFLLVFFLHPHIEKNPNVLVANSHMAKHVGLGFTVGFTHVDQCKQYIYHLISL